MKALKLIFTFTMWIANMNAQTYTPLPNTTAIWTGNQCSYFSSSGMIYKTGMFGDTLINTLSYKKIYGSTDFHFNLSTASYLCALRESGKKVYYIKDGNVTESLLYNFNLDVGDTAKIKNIMGSYVALKVDSIDQVMVNGQPRKRWTFNANGSFHTKEYWIEGIGSNFGLLWPLLSISDNIYSLLCVSSEGTVIYHDQSIANNFICFQVPNYDCDAFVSTSVQEREASQLTTCVFPNPFSAQATLTTNQELTDAELVMYDVTGREVYRLNRLYGTEITLYNTHLARGSYYYKLTERHKLLSKGKLIIE